MSNITTLMNAALKHADSLVDASASASSNAASIAAGGIGFAGPGVLGVPHAQDELDRNVPRTPTEGHVSRGDHIEVYLPSKADPAAIYNQFDSRYKQIWNDARDALANFFATYFPNQSALTAAVDNWLQATIAANGANFQGVENQLWANSRNRIMAEQLSEENAMYAQFASRGFPLPSGALAAQLQELRIQQSNKLAEVSNTAAIKHLDISVDLIKFAIDQAVKLRIAALGAAVDYIKAVVLEPADIAARFVMQTGGLQADLIRAVASYYGALLERDRILSQLRLGEKEIDAKWGGIVGSIVEADVQARSRAAAQAADAAAHAAAGALSALNSIGAQVETI